jgi:hypothetical protein
MSSISDIQTALHSASATKSGLRALSVVSSESGSCIDSWCKGAMARKSQSQRFKDTARELGADESGETFERAVRKIVPAKHPESRKITEKPAKSRKRAKPANLIL